MAKKNNIQARVADTVTQEPTRCVLGGKTYMVAPPTLGTLILASKEIGSLPEFDNDTDDKFGSVLKNAKDAEGIATVCAVLILGAKESRKRQFLGGRTKAQALAARLLNEASPKELHHAIQNLLFGLELGDFFVLTTFLQDINLTKPTKVDKGTQATASGQQ